MALITLEQAKRQLRIDHDDDNADLLLKMEQASAIVVDYIKRPDHGWTEETVPPLVQAAILIVLTDLYDRRNGTDKDDVLLSKPVRDILERFRDPAFA